MYKLSGLHRSLYKWVMRFYVADAPAFYTRPDVGEAVDTTFPPFRQLDLNAMAHYFAVTPQTDIAELLPRITAWTLAVAGDRDPIVPPEQSRLVARRGTHAVHGAGQRIPAGSGRLAAPEFSARPA
jgi:pimeloyl-ACP methyl ester carboxylesterase